MRRLACILSLLLVLKSPGLRSQVSFAGEGLPTGDSRVMLTLDRFIKIYRREPGMDSVRRLALEVFPILTRILEGAGVPEDFKYVPVVESAFDVFAVSSAGARGMWQFMPRTAAAYGLRVQKGKDERSNFVKSTISACRYLKRLYNLFGSWQLAAAAYNCGEGTLSRAIRKSGSRNYFDLPLCRETSEYLYRIAAVKHVFETDDRYGAFFRKGASVGTAQTKEIRREEKQPEGFRTVYFDRDSISIDESGWHNP